MGLQASQALLTEILLLLQTLDSSVADFQKEVMDLRDDLERVEERLEDFIKTYMPDDIAGCHVKHHRKLAEKSFFRRILLRLAGEEGA